MYSIKEDLDTITLSTASKSLVFYRNSYKTSLQETAVSDGTNIYGILGTISLSSGDYLLVITKALWLGSVYSIYKILDVEFVSLSGTKSGNDAEKLVGILRQTSLYFSYNVDLTNSLPGKDKVNDKFFFNKYLFDRGIQVLGKEIMEFSLVVIQGFVGFCRTRVRGRNLELLLIGRRDKDRIGPRFHSRGIDKRGNVSNFVETEQVLAVDGERLSMVQIRGSLPFYWGQEINLRYTPQRTIQGDSLEPFVNHMSHLISNYGKIIVINLINKTGYEGPLGDEFLKYVLEMDDSRIRYVHFDFHKECSKMRWDRISLLIQELRQDLISQGFTRVDSNRNLLRVQSSVNRINCMDCLDRTNVVQSEIAKLSLESQLRELGILQVGESMEFLPEFHYLFKNLWADHADIISLFYSGTGALKTDFTRNGKRTFLGMFSDLKNSGLRYFKNNFSDGYKQDAFDVLLGVSTLETRLPDFNEKIPQELILALAILVYCFSAVFILFVAHSTFFSLKDLASFSFFYLGMALHIFLFYYTIRWIFYNGKTLANYPSSKKWDKREGVSSSEFIQLKILKDL